MQFAAEKLRAGPRPRWSWQAALWLVPLVLLLVIVISDLFGWAYLRTPIAGLLSSRMGRPVEIDPPFSFHLRPSIPVRAGAVRVAAPPWSSQPHFVDARGIEADVNWGVLLGRQPVLRRLAVAEADIHAERDGQGRASWSLAGQGSPADRTGIPVIEQLAIGRATVDVEDAMNDLAVKLEARAEASGIGDEEVTGTSGGQRSADDGLVVSGIGNWRKAPISFELRSSLGPILAGGALTDLEVKGKLQSTELAFDGSVSNLTRLGDLSGRISVVGPSLGDLSIIPGVTLPATPPYRLEGDLQRAGNILKMNVERAEIGSSSMKARLEYDDAGATPLLRGTLDASRLVLQDLGPAIGGSSNGAAATPAGKGGNGADRVLPAKEFDLAVLRAMNADVALDLQKLDLGSSALRPLTSLKARLQLDGGVLELQDLRSSLSGGTVTGSTVLDGSSAQREPALDARLKWNRVDLKTWLTAADKYLVAGRFSGETLLKGTGRSTAAIMKSLTGSVKGSIVGGSISHQVVELAGLDVAQSLGVFLGGDQPLVLSCALVDLSAEKGRLESRLFLLNTPDTIFFVQGSVDLGSEQLDLRLVQSPKDWSLMSLRSPLTITGTLSNPSVGIDPAPLALKLLSSVVLAFVNPFAALLPLIDLEDNTTREGCRPAIDQFKKQAAEFGSNAAAPQPQPQPPPLPADEGSPPQVRRDANDSLRQPGRLPGERP